MNARAFGAFEYAIALAFILVSSCSGCAYYTAPEPLPRVHIFDGSSVGPNTIGATYCDGNDRPVFWQRSDVVRDNKWRPFTMAHEDAHTAQAAAIGGCANFWTWYYAGRANAIGAEADAYCASVRYGIGVGEFRSVLDGAQFYASSLADPSYGFRLSWMQAVEWIIAACRVRTS